MKSDRRRWSQITNGLKASAIETLAKNKESMDRGQELGPCKGGLLYRDGNVSLRAYALSEVL